MQPTCRPTTQPSRQPSVQPSKVPTMQPSSQPSRYDPVFRSFNTYHPLLTCLSYIIGNPPVVHRLNHLDNLHRVLRINPLCSLPDVPHCNLAHFHRACLPPGRPDNLQIALPHDQLTPQVNQRHNPPRDLPPPLPWPLSLAIWMPPITIRWVFRRPSWESP